MEVRRFLSPHILLTDLQYSGPWIVIAKDRGKVLRFYRTGLLHMRNGGLREMLRDKAYESYPPWNSSFGPDGD